VYAFSDVYSGNGGNSHVDGSYTIERLPSGSYTVQVNVTGYVSKSNDGVIVTGSNDTSGVNFTLDKIVMDIQ